MVFSLGILLALLAAAVIVGGVIGSSSQHGGEDMIKNVYLYVVLFATLMMTIGGSVGVFMAAADIVSPAPYYQSFEDFQRWGKERSLEEYENEKGSAITEAELREQYENMVRSETDRQIARAKNSLIKSLGWIAIPLPVFLFFSRKLRQKDN